MVAGALIGVLSPVWLRSEAWRPPTLTLLSAPNQVLVARVVDFGSDHDVLWRTVDAIRGETPELFSMPLDGRGAMELERGRDYVLATTLHRHHANFREGLELDPAGPRLVDVPGLGRALFPSSPALVGVLTAARDGSLDAESYLADLQDLMVQDWPGVQRFALTELYLRPELWAHADSGIAAVLRARLSEQESDWQQTDLILAIGQRLAPPLQQGWLAKESRRILMEAPSELPLAGGYPPLVERALQILAAHDSSRDADPAVRHLASNSPGVVKAAIAAAEILDCSQGVAKAREILERSDRVHQESQRSLEAFVDRGCPGA